MDHTWLLAERLLILLLSIALMLFVSWLLVRHRCCLLLEGKWEGKDQRLLVESPAGEEGATGCLMYQVLYNVRPASSLPCLLGVQCQSHDLTSC